MSTPLFIGKLIEIEHEGERIDVQIIARDGEQLTVREDRPYGRRLTVSTAQIIEQPARCSLADIAMVIW